ncbi:hypothetical protein BFAG_02064 [Bacteroides fragilis 3_1_12]|uniref:Transcriptional regulator n=1 Tax=Bacteroides fragilis 3_1_12 TaxID=457424 RepID=A0ABN0BKH6_BACFG|nr:hypothetical protein BFAG_02064 [Bacteroides fragilis 3_1_12]
MNVPSFPERHDKATHRRARMQKIGADWCRLVQKCTVIPIAVLRTLCRGETEP